MATTSCWFLVFVWVWLLPPMLAGANEQQGEGCSIKRCGNLTISHPFWLVYNETGRPCGPLDFEVTCRNNSTPVLRSSADDGFAIIRISYKERSLRVVDLYKRNHLHDTNSCHVPSWNISVHLGFQFRVDPVNLNLVLYNCTKAAAAVARQDRVLVPIRCGNKSNTFVRAGGRYDATDDYARYYMDGCEATIVPVFGAYGMANASNYEQLISDGFLLTWKTGSERRGKKIMLIGMTSAAATFLFACLYVLIWRRKGKRLWFLLCKKTSSNTEKNYEAMIVSYGSLAPKRYMYSEVMKTTSSRNNQLGKGGYGVVFKGKLHVVVWLL